MRLLAIDTSRPEAGIGLSRADGTTDEIGLPAGASSATLLPAIGELLQRNDCGFRELQAIAVSAGPGSFTGLRAGIAVANGLGFALGLPVLGIPTLHAVAELSCPPGHAVTVLLRAYRGGLYAARFARRGAAQVVERLSDDALLPPQEALACAHPDDLLVGEAGALATVTASAGTALEAVAVGHAASGVAACAVALPPGGPRLRAAAIYLRAPDAVSRAVA